jgi:hypothetical protein
MHSNKRTKAKLNSVALVCKQTTRPSNHHLSAKLVPTFADRSHRLVRAMVPHSHILSFLDRSCYYFFQVAPWLYSRSCMDPVPDPLLLRKSDSARNRTRDLWICSQELCPLGHRGCLYSNIYFQKWVFISKWPWRWIKLSKTLIVYIDVSYLELAHSYPVLRSALAVTMKITVFWNMMPCSLADFYWHFTSTCCLHLQDRRVMSVTNNLTAY